jgi:hypothetical protein
LEGDGLKKVTELEEEIERMNKMFFLQMKIKGYLKEFSDDYFN